MKRVGTITSALGFIFLGVWLLIRNVNLSLAEQLIKWWPILIVLFGLEIIFLFNNKKEGERIGFNFLIIPLIIAFIFTNLYVNMLKPMVKDFNIFENGFSISESIFDLGDSKNIKVDETLDRLGSKIEFITDNSDLKIRKSTDDKIKLDIYVHVKNGSNVNNYDIKEQKISDGYKININENYVKGVSGVIYIPDGYNIKLENDNMKLNTEDEFLNSEFYISGNNGTFNFKGLKLLNMDIDNFNINGSDIRSSIINGDNGSVDIKGNKVEESIIQIDNGKVNIENKLCKNIKVSLKRGTVNVKTIDRNIQADLNLNKGKVNLNGGSRVNSSIVTTLGNGAGKVDIKVDTGSINVSTSQEW